MLSIDKSVSWQKSCQPVHRECLQVGQVWYFISKRPAGTLEHSNPFKKSPGSHSWFGVGIMSSCSLLAFLLLVSLALSRLHCLYSSVSRTHNCARLLIVATPGLKAAVKLAKVKSHGNKVWMLDVIIAHVISGDAQKNRCRKQKAVLRPAGCAQNARQAGKEFIPMYYCILREDSYCESYLSKCLQNLCQINVWFVWMLILSLHCCFLCCHIPPPGEISSQWIPPSSETWKAGQAAPWSSRRANEPNRGPWRGRSWNLCVVEHEFRFVIYNLKCDENTPPGVCELNSSWWVRISEALICGCS